MKRSTGIILCFVVALLLMGNVVQVTLNWSPPLYFDAIPDEATAISVSEIILSAGYGDHVRTQQQPFTAYFDAIRGVWIVEGSIPEGYVGGTARLTIRKADGKVLEFYHSL